MIGKGANSLNNYEDVGKYNLLYYKELTPVRDFLEAQDVGPEYGKFV
jgi:hypothetical protein